MTAAQFKKLALSLEGTTAAPHFDRTAFKVKTIFATIGRDGKRVNLKIEPAEKRESLMESFPDAFFSLGGWTRLGMVAIDLKAVDPALLEELVVDAWERARPKKKKR